MAFNGYKMVKGHFSWEQIAKEYIKIYKEISRIIRSYLCQNMIIIIQILIVYIKK